MAKTFDRKIGCLGLVKGAQSSRNFELTEAIFSKPCIAVRYPKIMWTNAKFGLRCSASFSSSTAGPNRLENADM